MAPSSLRKAIGAVKDKTSIGLAKVSNTSTVSDLDVAIVKATRHDEFPAEERHLREILSLTCYSRALINACVSSLSRRLGKTRSWSVALKTLILLHRLLSEGDAAYEQEIYHATRRGSRMLNMSDFRDTSRSDAWDFSAFVRTFAMYLDERLEYRMHGRRARRSRTNSWCGEEEDAEARAAQEAASREATPVMEMKTESLFKRTQHLQQLMERFLACRPTGAAKGNRIVAVALYPLVKESFQIYFDLAELIGIYIDRFMELEVADCVRIHSIFLRLAKQFEELEHFYSWCKTAGICRTSEYPEVERITSKKLDVMDEFIREKAALASNSGKHYREPYLDEQRPPDEDYNTSSIKALPAPEPEEDQAKEEEEEEEEEPRKKEAKGEQEPKVKEAPKDTNPVLHGEGDLLNLRDDAAPSGDRGGMLALALFDGELASSASGAPKWEAFKNVDDSSDWEAALVVSASNLSAQKPAPGGGFDMLMLDGMYNHGYNAAVASAQGYSGCSASSVVVRAPSTAATKMLALPAPPTSRAGIADNGDPFAASLMVLPPSYVQMSEMEKKQQLLVEEQVMWQQYKRDGMQGQLSLARFQQQQQQQPYPMGGYPQRL